MLELEDVKGRSIRAEIVEMNGDDAVTIRREDGRLFSFLPLTNFSKKSRSQIEAYAKRQEELEKYPPLTEKSNLSIRFARGRDDDLNNDGDPDDRVVVMEPTVSVRNNDFNTTYRDVKGVLIVIGENVINSGEMRILSRDEFTITLPYRETVRWKGATFTNRYDEYAGNGVAFGYKYDDYLVILYDENGKIVHARSKSKRNVDNAERILKARTNTSYDEDFEKKVPETRIPAIR